MTSAKFVEKWRAVTASERAVAQSHFNDLAALLEVPNPLEADPDGKEYAFERHVRKAARGKGFADVWKRGAFAWEYKAKGKDLGDAYRQLLLYRDDLENPPLLVVSDIDRVEVHTNFTGTTKAVYTYTLDDLLDAGKRNELKRVWTDPNWFDPREHRERITEDATVEIGRIALSLRERGHDAERVAHFMMQLVFALFAEDTELLPNRLVTKILQRAENPQRVQEYLTQLFRAMSTGGEVLLEDVPHFNGGLFDGTEALPLTQDEINILYEAAQLDWAEVEPAIFGTLFERSLDPEKRSQLGAHYTSRIDILRIVEPVVMQPLRRRWNDIREAAEDYLADPPTNGRSASKRRTELVDAPMASFLHELHGLRVLDPACGSGNFLYVALQALKELEHEVVTFAEQVGSPGLRLLGPRQFHGIEINPFAQELASMVVWIGYLQWNRANGITSRQAPILEPLENIRFHDALMNEDGTEYEWPEAEFIIGNPPFLGSQRMRSELGDQYVETLRRLFDGRLPGNADLVCYWFEKARAQVEADVTKRVGLIATNSIRGGGNRRVLERIAATGTIFEAWSDEPWVLDGAAVRVSIVCFAAGPIDERRLDGRITPVINVDLTSVANLAEAKSLQANRRRAFQGTIKMGDFDVPGDLARSWLDLPNASGRSNREVVRPWVNGMDITRTPSDTWIIDFNEMALSEAALFEVPMAYVVEHVRQGRERNRDQHAATHWWRHHRPRPDMRSALAPLRRFIATPRVAKHRIFVWLDKETLPDSAVVAIAAEDDFTFGVLHSRIHEVWSLAMGTSLGVGNDPRYTPTTCFETFAFPEPTGDQHDTISAAAKHLDAVRCHLLDQDARLTLTKLYNEVEVIREDRDPSARAFPLLLAHEALDAAVAAAYGWPWPLTDDVILECLLGLNLDRSSDEAG